MLGRVGRVCREGQTPTRACPPVFVPAGGFVERREMTPGLDGRSLRREAMLRAKGRCFRSGRTATAVQ